MMRWTAFIAAAFFCHLAAADTLLELRLAAIHAALSDEIPFREERHSQILAQPAIFEGWLRYDAQTQSMSKVVVRPEAVSMSVDDRDVTIERDGETRRLALHSRPELGALLDGFRGLLTGDTAMLEKNFKLEYSESGESGDAWHLRMTPRSRRLARQVEVLIVNGRADRVAGICTRLANGDWQHIELLSELTGDD